MLKSRRKSKSYGSTILTNLVLGNFLKLKRRFARRMVTCKQGETVGDSDDNGGFPAPTHENGITITAKANGKFKLERFDDWERKDPYLVADNLDCKFTSTRWDCRKSEDSRKLYSVSPST